MKLKIGDRIYIKRYSQLESVQTILKLTPTTAKSKNYTFNIEVEENGYCKVKGSDIWSNLSAKLEDEELKKEWKKIKLQTWIEKKKFTDEEVEQIYNLFGKEI